MNSVAPNVVIRGGHIIPSIRLTPPDSRPLMADSVPEQDLGPNMLFVPLKTEEVGWEAGGIIWPAKRYFYPIVNLYGGLDDHVIGTYRGGPEGYRFVKITDSAFALADQDDEEVQPESSSSSITQSKTSKTSLPKGPATKIQSHREESSIGVTNDILTDSSSGEELDSTVCSNTSESSSSTPSSSRRGSSSTDDDCLSGADTGTTTPTLGSPGGEESSEKHSVLDMAKELEAALISIQQEEDSIEPKKMRLASRTGAVEICSDPVDVSRLAGPLKSQLYSNSLGLDRSLTLSESVPAAHFQIAPGRSRSRRPLDSEYAAGWSYEQNMEHEIQTAPAK